MRCPATDCTTVITSDRVMCRPHWFMVPKEIRAEVWSAWQAVLDFRVGVPPGASFEDISRRHDHAKAAAINAVNQKLEWRRAV